MQGGDTSSNGNGSIGFGSYHLNRRMTIAVAACALHGNEEMEAQGVGALEGIYLGVVVNLGIIDSNVNVGFDMYAVRTYHCIVSAVEGAVTAADEDVLTGRRSDSIGSSREIEGITLIRNSGLRDGDVCLAIERGNTYTSFAERLTIVVRVVEVRHGEPEVAVNLSPCGEQRQKGGGYDKQESIHVFVPIGCTLPHRGG